MIWSASSIRSASIMGFAACSSASALLAPRAARRLVAIRARPERIHVQQRGDRERAPRVEDGTAEEHEQRRRVERVRHREVEARVSHLFADLAVGLGGGTADNELP